MKHLTGIDDLSDADITAILDNAQSYADTLATGGKIERSLKRKVIVNMFFENSTRTRMSFEMAELRLGASVINWDPDSSSLSKGETFSDTIRMINSTGPDAIVIRHAEYNAPQIVAKLVDCPVINAGDSWREHPTQALLDALTMRQAKGTIDGLTVAICGDVAHSRVAASNFALLSRLGAKLRAIAPDFLMPQKFPAANIETFTSIESGLLGCDVVMMLRNQKERMQAGQIPDDATFYRQYGLTPDRLALAKPDAIVMHPAPMNRGVEIADDIADGPQSLIFKQMQNGTPTRMAVLDYLLNA